MHIFLGESNTHIYSIMGYIADALMFVYICFQLGAKKSTTSYYAQSLAHELSKGNSKIYKFITNYWNLNELFVMIGLISLCIGMFNRALGSILHTGGNYFGLVFSIMLIWPITSFIFGTNPLKQLDIITPALPLHLTCAKIGCFCAGCCHGVPWEQGLFNHRYNEYQIPVQLIETFWALLLFVLLIVIRKKVKTGTIFPLYILLYSATRFCSEFLRNEPNVFGPLKTYHILCLVGIMFGFVLLAFISTYRTQINAFYDRKQEEINEKYLKSE